MCEGSQGHKQGLHILEMGGWVDAHCIEARRDTSCCSKGEMVEWKYCSKESNVCFVLCANESSSFVCFCVAKTLGERLELGVCGGRVNEMTGDGTAEACARRGRGCTRNETERAREILGMESTLCNEAR